MIIGRLYPSNTRGRPGISGMPTTVGYDGPEHAYCNRTAPHRCVTSREW